MEGGSCSGGHGTKFSVLLFGNVMESRGSDFPFLCHFRTKAACRSGTSMKIFLNSLEQGVDLVCRTFGHITGRKKYVRKTPSTITILIAKVVALKKEHTVMRIQPPEELHVIKICVKNPPHIHECSDYYKVVHEIITNLGDEAIKCSKKVIEDFDDSSSNYTDLMAPNGLAKWIEACRPKTGAIL